MWGWESKFRAYPDAGMAMIEYPYTLLRDGTCVRSILGSLDDATLASYRRSHPKDLCRWKKVGASYQVTGANGSFSSPPNRTVLRSATKGQHIAGTYARSQTGTLATAVTWRGTTIVFDDTGHFESNVGSHVHTTARAPSRQHTIAGTSSTGRERGTYILDGFSIDLHFESGRVEHHVFGMTSDPTHSWIRLGNVTLPRSGT